MARTRLRQIEQVKNSFAYDDALNMGTSAGSAVEGQSGATIGADNAIVSTSATTIVVAEDLVNLGLNAEDQVTTSGTSSDDTYIVTSVSYSAPNTTITINPTGLAGTTFGDEGAAGNAQAKVDDSKNLSRDLDFIRTQLRKLTQKTNWYDTPLGSAAEKYELVTGSAVSAGTEIILDGAETFDAGEPYTFKVYLNGVLQLPSTVSSNVVTTTNDYTERDSTQPVGLGETGDRIVFAFDIDDTDLIQFKWAKAASC